MFINFFQNDIFFFRKRDDRGRFGSVFYSKRLYPKISFEIDPFPGHPTTRQAVG